MKLKTVIPEHLYEKIMFFVNKSPIEISMMARVKIEKDVFTLTQVYLLEQENTAVTTDINAAALAKLMYETRADEGFLNCWIHSHVNMGVGWSATDRATMEEFGTNGFLLSLVFNKKEEVNCSYFQGTTDDRPALVLDSVPVERLIPTPKAHPQWEKEYTDKCKKKTYNYSGSTGKGNSLGKFPILSGNRRKNKTSLLREHSGAKKNGKTTGTCGNRKEDSTTDIEHLAHGDINPKNLNQRWHVYKTGFKEWVAYSRYCHLNKWYDKVNMLDAKKGYRAGWIRLFRNAKGEDTPLFDDYAVNEYFMEVEGVTSDEFYLMTIGEDLHNWMNDPQDAGRRK